MVTEKQMFKNAPGTSNRKSTTEVLQEASFQ